MSRMPAACAPFVDACGNTSTRPSASAYSALSRVSEGTAHARDCLHASAGCHGACRALIIMSRRTGAGA